MSQTQSPNISMDRSISMEAGGRVGGQEEAGRVSENSQGKLLHHVSPFDHS